MFWVGVLLPERCWWPEEKEDALHKMSTKTTLPTVNEKATESVSMKLLP